MSRKPVFDIGTFDVDKEISRLSKEQKMAILLCVYEIISVDGEFENTEVKFLLGIGEINFNLPSNEISEFTEANPDVLAKLTDIQFQILLLIIRNAVSIKKAITHNMETIIWKYLHFVGFSDNDSLSYIDYIRDNPL